jgi:hypothetical protein
MKTRAALIGAGILTMLYAVGGALFDPGLEAAGVLVFLVAVLAAHDAIWMPVVLVAGAALTRLVPRRLRPAARVAAISAASVTVVALPLVLGFGRTADNPSALPLPYGRNLVFVLLVIAAATLPAIGRKKSERPRAGGDDPDDR